MSLAVGLSAAYAAGLIAWFLLSKSIGLDFGVYWRAANEPLASVYLPRDVLNFPYAPTMLLWVAPLALLPLWLAYPSWVIISIGAFAAACRGLLNRQEIALALISPPIVYALLNGQVTIALTALLLWACGTSNRPMAGIALAIIASIKPHLVIMAPLLMLATRDWRALLTAFLATVTIVLTSAWAFGFETWQAWAQSVGHFNAILTKNNVLVVAATPYSVARYWGLSPIPFLIVGAALGAWLVVNCRGQGPLQQSAAVATGSLLAAPYAITYDLSPLVPFLAWSVSRGRIAAALAMSGTLNPLPLLLTAYCLFKRPADQLRKNPVA